MRMTCSEIFKIGPYNIHHLLLSSTFLLVLSNLHNMQRQGIHSFSTPEYVPGIGMVGGESNDCKLSNEPQPCFVTCVPTYINTQVNKWKNGIKF